jgi:hypothetical protein
MRMFTGITLVCYKSSELGATAEVTVNLQGHLASKTLRYLNARHLPHSLEFRHGGGGLESAGQSAGCPISGLP